MVRSALYPASASAMRFNPLVRPFAERVKVVAIARTYKLRPSSTS